MLGTVQKKRLFSIERIWFTNHASSKCDIIRYNRADNPLPSTLFTRNEKNETVISDLTKSIDELVSKCTKTIKYEIKKCLNEDVDIAFYDSTAISVDSQVFKDFKAAYLELAEGANNKDLLKAFSPEKIDNFIKNDCLLLTYAKRDNSHVYHVYVFDDRNCVLLYSASNFRTDDKNARNLTGRMNKLLHFKDMEYFKSLGVESYDWGNISSSTNPNGIDQFKMSFGGEIKDVYNIFVGNTLKGKLMVFFIKLLQL